MPPFAGTVPIVPNKLPAGQRRASPLHILLSDGERREWNRAMKRAKVSSLAELARVAVREKAERDGLLKP